MEEIALLSTALVRWDGSRIMYPNVKMSTDMLVNITRSGNKGDTFRVGLLLCYTLPLTSGSTQGLGHSDPTQDMQAPLSQHLHSLNAHKLVTAAPFQQQAGANPAAAGGVHADHLGGMVQVLVDMSTPRQVFEALEAAVRKHLLDNPLDFTGDTAITMDKNPTAGNEPLKVVIMIYWCYKFNGEPALLGHASGGDYQAPFRRCMPACLPPTNLGNYNSRNHPI